MNPCTAKIKTRRAWYLTSTFEYPIKPPVNLLMHPEWILRGSPTPEKLVSRAKNESKNERIRWPRDNKSSRSSRRRVHIHLGKVRAYLSRVPRIRKELSRSPRLYHLGSLSLSLYSSLRVVLSLCRGFLCSITWWVISVIGAYFTRDLSRVRTSLDFNIKRSKSSRASVASEVG